MAATKPSKRNKIINDIQLMPNILEDVIIEILSWLPVKSLLRIRCVSKSWLSLISSPNFIKLHVTKSFNNHEYTRHRLVFRSLEVADNYYKFRFKQGFFHPTFYDAQTTEPIDMDDSIGCNEDVFVGPSPRMVYFPIVNIVGSYNGLICVTSYGDIFLWNPSIRKSRKLPNFPPRLNSNNVYEFYAYGYDESNDDYKVFRILCGSEYHGTKGCLDLYSRNTNSWRRIEDLKVDFIRGVYYTKGKLHWITDKGEKMGTLDLASETYGEMEQPRYGDEGLIYCELKGFSGCLSLICYYQSSTIMWIMKEYGVKDSWTNVASLQHSDLKMCRLMRPVFVSEDGEILFHKSGTSTRLVIYNPKCNSLACHQITNVTQLLELNIFVESLVLPSNDHDGV